MVMRSRPEDISSFGPKTRLFDAHVKCDLVVFMTSQPTLPKVSQ